MPFDISSRFTASLTAIMQHSLIVIAALFITASMHNTVQAELEAGEKAEIREMIEEYILNNPELLRDTLTALAAREEAQRKQLAFGLVRLDAKDPALGNPDADVTIYEFSDYNCGYCKRLFTTLQEVLEEDKNVRLVLKEFPILAESSVYAAQTALAIDKQGKFQPFHIGLMNARGRLDERLIDRVAEQAGANMAQLAIDRESPEILTILQANQQAAQALDIRGTPALIIGDNLVPGAISKDEIFTLINQARTAKRN